MDSMLNNENNKESYEQTIKLLRSYNALCVNAQIAQTRVADIRKAMTILTPEERLIINRFYIDEVDNRAEMVLDLSDQLNTERSSVYRKCKAAVKKLTIALYGLCNC